ncbi:HTTM domain-containing protein [Stieleria varia]|nr:HTTM domain-containing protein [Stieleria varia]
MSQPSDSIPGTTSRARFDFRQMWLGVDPTFLIVFRVILAFTIASWAQHFLSDDRYRSLFIEPRMLFKYPGFHWVQLWPGDGLYWHFRITQLAALALIIGFLTRLAAATLSLSMLYILLLERQLYNNHDYLLICCAALLVFLPASCRLSVDSRLGIERQRRRIPRWQLWLLRFQLGLPYVYGAIAKLNADWLAGQPAEIFLHASAGTSIIGPYLTLPMAKWLMAYGGLVFDALIVPLLMFHKTRAIAIGLALGFHLTNAVLFNIGVFPWFMLATLYVFFPPELIAGLTRRLLRTTGAIRLQTDKQIRHRRLSRIGFCIAAIYVIVQLLLPFRHWLMPGDASWNGRGHRFAWRMMLRHKESLTWFKIENDTGFLYAPATLVMTPYQSKIAVRDPEMIQQAALKIQQLAWEMGQSDCRVYVLALTSLNGRRPVPIIDPDADLTKVQRGWLSNDWVRDEPGPFLDPAWNVPQERWWTELTLPERFAALQGQSLARWQADFERFAQYQKSVQAANQNPGNP